MKTFRKIFSAIIMVVLLSTFVGCTDVEQTDDKRLTLSESSAIMYVFDVKTLTLNTNSDEQIVWTCTNENCLSLTPNGKTVTVQALRRGEVFVVATQGENSVSCVINVFPTYKDFSVTITSAKTAQLAVGEQYQIECAVTIDQEEFDGATLEYRLTESSPKGCVLIDDNGLVTAEMQGVTRASVRARFGDTYSEWQDVTIYVFEEDYNNADQQRPDGYIEDVFGE